jgi:tetratricopeptide (TPR) repeat protein
MSVETISDDAASRTDPQPGDLIANRFRVQALLGRGGTGWALRVRDETEDRSLALKLLELPPNPKRAQQLTELFEREFHSLTDLAHPRVVTVFDYGVWNGRPFYTLELLDGGDVQTLAPLPWQDACSVAYDICSALSLLHSRRLLHRDITPRNIRWTADGKAKLIDFGLLSPLGAVGVVAGTPPFIAPELIQRSALDARSDLFSLGCTLYYALTGRVCFPARSFAQLSEFWQSYVAPPSSVAPEIPDALDELVLTLMRTDVASRPKSAAEVMERLRPLLRTPPDEELSAARSYLSTPQLFGRDRTLAVFREQLLRAKRERGAGFIVVGESGVGRSRMINAFVLEAKVIGATTLRASAADGVAGPFGVAAALASDLLAAQPATAQQALRDDPELFGVLFRETAQESAGVAAKLELRLELGQVESDRVALQTALRGWFLRVARDYALALAVDDFDQIDEPSAALLATLTWDAAEYGLVYALSSDVQTPRDASHALAIVYHHATRLELQPLTAAETNALLASVFGDVPNLHLLSRRLFDLCGGRPRDCMALAQHLVDNETVVYADGNWILPVELAQGLLPAHMEDAFERRIAAQRPLSRRVGLMLALSLSERLNRAQLLRLEGVTSAEIDRTLEELRANQIATGTTASYALCHASLANLLTARAGPAELAEAHRDLAAIFEASGESTFAILHHLFHGGRTEAAIARMVALSSDPQVRIREIDRADTELGTDRIVAALILGLQQAMRLQRSPAELQAWRAMLAGMSARGADANHYYSVSKVWLAQLKLDSGFDDWHALGDGVAPGDRIRRALGQAGARREALPPEQRGYIPAEAIKSLIGYVAMSIAVAARVLDVELQESLPPLLEPFAPLSPLVDAMLWNARATCLNGEGKREQGRALFIQVLEKMANLDNAELGYLVKVQAAIQQTIAEIDASLGIRSDYVKRLDEPNRDPNHRVGAHYIKKILALNEGDWAAAERHRRDAELLSLQSNTRSMFSTLWQELEAHALARDLTGVKQVRASIGAMAKRHPGWVPVLRIADVQYLRLCGDLTGALRGASALRQAGDGDADSRWSLSALAIEGELLVELRRADEAYTLCEPAWVHCDREGMAYLARGLACALTLADAARGRFDRALARIERVIADLLGLGVRGLHLGRAYECAARVALKQGDTKAFEAYAEHVAEHYRSSSGAMQGLAYQRLLEDARRGPGTSQVFAVPGAARDMPANVSRIATIMTESSGKFERAQRALALLCEVERSPEGYLFLTTGSALELVASSGNERAAAGLKAFAQAWFNARVALEEVALTTIETQAATDFEDVPDSWVSERGERHSAVLLRAQLAGQVRAIGVAVLRDVAHDRTAFLTPLATAVAAHLTEFCEVER